MKQTLNINQDPLTTVAQAASNASEAAHSAAEAASQASQNAQIAAKAVAESATAIAVVATDTSWMKKSLVGIEDTLKKIQDNFPTRQEHNDLLKITNNHEVRIKRLEDHNLKNTVLLGIGIGILSLLASLMIYHIIGK
jgi:hypothetical protein